MFEPESVTTQAKRFQGGPSEIDIPDDLKYIPPKRLHGDPAFDAEDAMESSDSSKQVRALEIISTDRIMVLMATK